MAGSITKILVAGFNGIADTTADAAARTMSVKFGVGGRLGGTLPN
jgi:hypothetical protein